MHIREPSTDVSAKTPISIPRVPSVADLSEFFKTRACVNRASRPDNRRFQPCTSVGGSEDGASDNSQVLYMKTEKDVRRKGRGSLGTVNNTSVAMIEERIDAKAELNSLAEELAWYVIDQEISMWQYVCETGRPYCWSTESRYNRSKKLQPKLPTRPGTRIWTRGMKDHTNNTSDSRRYNTSESDMVEDSPKVDTLARMIALQLLGSCFTLPPDNLSEVPENSMPSEHSTVLPDPRMISSLRLHTHFRYSPCFGHEPRSPSPVQSWPGAYDGPLSPPEKDHMFEDSEISVELHERGRSRSRRSLDNSEVSTSGYSIHSAEGNISRQSTLDNDPYAITKAWHRRNSLREAVSRSLTLPHLPNDGKVFAMRSRTKKRKQKITTPRSTPSGYLTPPSTGSREQFRSRSQAGSSRLQPVLQSEPHSVYVQPVKDMVIKPWLKFRRRFGSSGYSSQYQEGSEDQVSETGQSGTASPVMGEGRVRRIRAQERGDIHSSGDSMGHNNTSEGGSYCEDLGRRLSQAYWLEKAVPKPRTRIESDTLYGSAEESACHNTPATVKAERSSWLSSGCPSPRFDLPDPIANDAAEAFLACNYTSKLETRTRGTVSSPLEPPPTPETTSRPMTPGAPGSIMSTLLDLPTFTGSKNISNNSIPLESHSKAMQPFSPSSMRIPNGRRRKSCLSEVCTPEDFQSPEGGREANERSVLSIIGSPLMSPVRESPPCSTFLSNDPLAHYCLTPVTPVGAAEPVSLRAPNIAMQDSPGLRRMSTNETQIFTPDPVGCEINGLPVGPEKKPMWSGDEQEKEPSFL